MRLWPKWLAQKQSQQSEGSGGETECDRTSNARGCFVFHLCSQVYQQTLDQQQSQPLAMQRNKHHRWLANNNSQWNAVGGADVEQ